VGVAVDRTGALIVADDVGNTVWRVTYAGANAQAPAA
jgi:glucose/arabinose dehydrogenase